MNEMKAWEYKEAVKQYAMEADVLIPDRKEILSTISKLATEGTSDAPIIADLGCGFGDVTAAILALRSGANIQMVDFSDEMIRLSGIRFKDNPKIKIIKHDLNLGLPASLRNLKFDSIVSCLTLHYIESENRIRLYEDILNQLKEGALFLNGDLFKCDSSFVDRWEFDNRIKWMMLEMKQKMGEEKSFDELKKDRLGYRKRMGEKPGTIWEMHDDMKRAGFRQVDCLWKNQCFAVMAATR